MATRAAKTDRRDPRIESWLQSNGVAFSFHDDPLPLGDIDLERSLRNQARYKDVDAAKVEQYAFGMSNGDVFPPIVLNRTSAKSKWLNVDGNHRVAAATSNECASWDYGWYEINVKPQMFTILAMQANTRHGLPTDIDERSRQAIYLVDNGATIPQAAASLNVPTKEVERRLSKLKQERRAQDAGVSMAQWEKISQPSRIKLALIHTNEGMLAATELVYKANLNNAEVSELVSTLNATRSGERQRKMVKDFESRYAERIQEAAGGVLTSQVSRRGQSPRARFATAMGMLGAVNDLTAIVDSFSAQERGEAAERARFEGERLIELSEKLAAGA